MHAAIKRMRTLHPRPPQEAIRVNDVVTALDTNAGRIYLVPAGFVLHLTSVWASLSLQPNAASPVPRVFAEAQVIANTPPFPTLIYATATSNVAGPLTTFPVSNNALARSDLDVVETSGVTIQVGSTPGNMEFYGAAGWSGYLLPATSEDGGL